MPALPEGAPESTLSRRLPILLRHSWYALNQAFRRRIAHLGLTPDQYTVLRNLSEAPGLSQTELCSRMASDPNTVAALTARMEAEGWIVRVVCSKDRRARRLELRAAGRKKLSAAKPIAKRLQAEVGSALDPDELEAFLNLLSKVARSCQSALEGSPPRGGMDL
jgi:DNA-binding MarR family transcriptional regulator